MKLSRIIISCMALAGVLSSCEEEFLDDPAAAAAARLEGYYFQLAGIGAPVSRTAYPDATHSDFEEGDRVGIFTLEAEGNEVQTNLLYAVVGDPAGPQALEAQGAKANEGADYKYLIYYPYDAAMTLDRLKNLAYTVSAGQDADEADADGLTPFERSDFLWDMAAVAADESGTPKTDSEGRQFVEVVMDHVGATIIINVVSGFGSGAVPTILSMQRTVAKGIDLTAAPTVQALRENVFDETGTSSVLEYKADDKSDLAMQKKAISSDPDAPESQGGTFRVVVPPQIIESGQEVVSFAGIKFKYTGADGKPLALKPGMRYTFHINDPTKPFIDIDDDDTWIFDVVDPVTGDKVGLLCREYIRYQPEAMVNRNDNFTKKDRVTGYPLTAALEGKTYSTKAISSQVWVFYDLWKFAKLKDHSLEKELMYRNQNAKKSDDDPYLDSGIALRFINDTHCFTDSYFDQEDELVAAGYDPTKDNLRNDNSQKYWPYPHLNLNSNGGLFVSDHGKMWVKSENGDYGESSKHQVEFWMHGGKIYWGCFEWANGFRFNGVKLFEMPAKQVTTEQAVRYGHINIIRGSDGAPIGTEVSYEPYLPSDRNVGVLIPKYINDSRNPDEGVITYPLVKIGYNNIWSKQGLRTRYYNDGEAIPCYQKRTENGKMQFDFPHIFKLSTGTFDANNGSIIEGNLPNDWWPGHFSELGKLDIPGSYAYPSHPEYFDVYNYLDDIAPEEGGLKNGARREAEMQYTKVYNFSAIVYRKDDLVPHSPDSRMSCYIPRTVRYYETMNYVGFSPALKFMTNHIAPRNGAETPTKEAIVEALKKQEFVTKGITGGNEQSTYISNASGFDLRAVGIYRPESGTSMAPQSFNGGFGQMGTVVAFWMDPDPTHTPLADNEYLNRPDAVVILQQLIWNSWSGADFETVHQQFFKYADANGSLDGCPMTEQQMYMAYLRSRIYCAVRPVLKFNHQNGPNPHEKTASAASVVRGAARMIKKAAETPTVKPQSRVTLSGDADVSVMLTPSTAF